MIQARRLHWFQQTSKNKVCELIHFLLPERLIQHGKCDSKLEGEKVMISNFIAKQLFSKLFTAGLLLLFIGTLEEQLISTNGTNYFFFDSIIFFSVGATLCVISFLFLLIEWVVLPFGTQTKRIKLYQGIGNLFAFAMLTGGWIFKEESSQNLASSLSFSFSSSGLIVAVLFGWVGNNIAEYISRKKINLEAVHISENKTPEKFVVKERGASGSNTVTTSRIPAIQN